MGITSESRKAKERARIDTNYYINKTCTPDKQMAASIEWETERVWGYRGTRVGEASQPGPQGDDNDHYQETDEQEEMEARRQHNACETILEKEGGRRGEHENWILDDLDKRGEGIGMRVVGQNFERKLYASEKNIVEAVEKMIRLEIDVLVGTEPGKASRFNVKQVKAVTRRYGFDVKLIKRDGNKNGGGVIMIMNQRWSKIPSVVTEYRPEKAHLRGRLMCLEFDNRQGGQHHKVQIIGAHLLNSAHQEMQDTKKLLSWIVQRKADFNAENDRAPTILIGDLNAAESSYLDTDREGVEHDSVLLEPDSIVIETIKSMRYEDLIRTRFPDKRVVTRAATHQTNRLLDRVMVNKQLANHMQTRVGVYRHSFLKAGSDHMMVVADLPIDTAGAAGKQIKIWEPYSYVKWSARKYEDEETRESAMEQFNQMLGLTNGEKKDDIEWIREAARATILEPKTMEYPKRPKARRHYTAEDWRTHKHLQALRSIRVQVLTDAIGHIRTSERVMQRTKKKIGHCTVIDKQRYKRLWILLKHREMDEFVEACTEMVTELERNLGKKERYERAKQMRKNMKVRKERFAAPDKKMLKLVINSIMQKYQAQQHITSAESGGEMKYGEEEVAAAIAGYFEEWMGSKVGVEQWWGKEGENTEAAWERMMNMDTSQISDPEAKEFVEVAYLRSFRHYKQKQDDEDLWGEVMQRVTIGDIRSEMKRFKPNKAPGPSGITIEMLKAMDDDNMERLLDTMNDVVVKGGKVPKSWNETILRPLPKTEAGLYDISKTRPIALMEVALKLMERVIFSRINKVIDDNNMLREEQYGGINARQMQDPIRILAELIEDANITKKELHIFSADLSKAFDTLEYWSQAMSWRALGAPKDMVNMLVDMDKGGRTAVILAPGRSTADVIQEKGKYSNQRGVRQGSVGGPMKWVVFMNFWLEYVHVKGAGRGYKMNNSTPEILGQMMIDDSNWFTNTAGEMTEMVADCNRFVTFHGLKFNKKKCEYMALNQSDDRRGGSEYEAWELPKWPSGEGIEPKARKVKNLHKWKKEHDIIEEQIKIYTGDCLEIENTDKAHPVTKQPKQGDIIRAKEAILEWEREIQNDEEGGQAARDRRDNVAAIINLIKSETYGGATPGEIQESTEDWAGKLQQWIGLRVMHKTNVGEATRYLGVFFNMDLTWRTQIQVLRGKFEELYDRITHTKPTTEMAIYCINAVINAAMKFPLQVAAIPVTVLREWDSKNRGVVKSAGKLPRNTCPELMHLPKKEGGKGLQSLEHEIDILRIQTQMRLLTTQSKAGDVVRAAKARHDKGDERKTIQYHTAAALRRWDMGIKCAHLPSGGCITGVDVQAARDVGKANDNARRRETVHAFGDGATWAKEGITGWGIQLQRAGGEVLLEDCGRTPGVQQNDASETYAILQSLLNTHTGDDIELYCDNQGCVNIWDKMTDAYESTTTLKKPKRGNYAAMWNRIGHIRRERMYLGSKTSMNWIQSHVQDEKKRTSTSSMITCACRHASGNLEECTRPGDRCHWLHEGNDEADRLAKEAKGLSEIVDVSELMKGEEEYVLYTGREVAQGEYREWIHNKLINKYIKVSKSVGINKLKKAQEQSQQTLWASRVKGLDKNGVITWRFWSRILTETLPTNHKLSTIANSSTDNVYHRVYGEELGPEGRCRRRGCTEESETTDHAICGCPRAKEVWEDLEAKITMDWMLQEYEVDWKEISWISNEYEGWKRLWTASGGIPKAIEERIGTDFSPQMHSRLIKAANLCAQTAAAIWKERNEENEAWIDSVPALRERKREADRTQWKYTAQKADRAPRKRNRIQQKAADRAEHKEAEEKRAEAAMAEWEETENEWREANKKLRVGPEEVERETKRLKSTVATRVVAEHRGIMKRARYAGSTPDMDTSGDNTTDMIHTTPMQSAKRTNRAFYWVPRKGTQVRVFWADSKGTMLHIPTKTKGTWHPAKVMGLEWPEDKGSPGAYLEYAADGIAEWASMDLFGDTVEAIESIIPTRKRKKRKKRGKGRRLDLLRSETFPIEATEYLGYGAIIEVNWKGAWHKGKVIGREEEGVMVRYPDGVATHNDLHKRGCRIKVFRENVDVDAIYARSPWMKCPLAGEEDGCTCWPCRTVKWPERYRNWGVSDEQIDILESISAGKRGEHYELFMGEGRLQLAEKDLRPPRANDDGGCDERGGVPTQDSDEHTEGQDGDQEGAREQSPPLPEGEEDSGQEESGRSMVLRSAAPRLRGAREQGHASKRRKQGDATGQRGGGARNGTTGTVRQARDDGVGVYVADGERGDEPTRGIRDQTREADATEERAERWGEDEGRTERDHSSPGAAGGTGRGDAYDGPELGTEQRDVGELDRGHRGMDANQPMDHNGPSAGDIGTCDGNEADARTAEQTVDVDAEPRGRMEIGGEAHCEHSTRGTHRGGGQAGLHLHGHSDGAHHGGGGARLVNARHRPDNGTVEESVGAGKQVEPGNTGTGVHPPLDSKRHQPEERQRPRQVGAHRTEHTQLDTAEANGGSGEVPTGERRDTHTADIVGEAPAPPVPPGEPSGLGALGVGNSGRDPGETAHLEEVEDRPVRVRPPGTEADDHPHKHRRMEAKRVDRERSMQGRKMHRNRDCERENGTPETNSREQQGEAGGQRKEDRRQVRVDDEGSSQCSRGGPTEGDHTSAVRGKPTPGKGPRMGPIQDDDDDTIERQRRETRSTTNERRCKQKRSREGGTQEGTRAAVKHKAMTAEKT